MNMQNNVARGIYPPNADGAIPPCSPDPLRHEQSL